MEDALNLRGPKAATPKPSPLSPEAQSPEKKQRWSPDPEGFDSLLTALHPDRTIAATRYTALRERLSRFFAWNNADDHDALADEVLDRLTRRVANSGANDEAIRQPEKFASGIARMLLREHWRDQNATATMLASLEVRSGTARKEQEERQRIEELSVAMDVCLARLPVEQRDLIERYYSTEARDQMDTRKRLAGEFGISLNALRNRAMRVRADVERCARTRLDEEAGVINKPAKAHQGEKE